MVVTFLRVQAVQLTKRMDGHVTNKRVMKLSALHGLGAGLIVTGLFCGGTAWAQAQGPIPPPPRDDAPAAVSAPVPSAAAARPAAIPRRGASGLRNEAPSIPVEQIIQRFAAHESEFRRERGNYTYTQTVIVQTIDYDGSPDGEFRQVSDILFTPEGKRYEKITFAPAPSLQKISLTQEDMDDLKNVQPFVLTTEDLAKYEVKYGGREQLDEISTYVFDVGPKVIEKKQRYFQGRIWVDDKDFAVVKTYGKAVPDLRSKNGENMFPRFETYRENIEKNYWFPTYTHADDELRFSSGAIRIRMTVRYSDYKRFGSSTTIRVLSTDPEGPPKP